MQDCGHPFYAGNYNMFFEAIKAAHPHMTVIANCPLGGRAPTEMYDWHLYTTSGSSSFHTLLRKQLPALSLSLLELPAS